MTRLIPHMYAACVQESCFLALTSRQFACHGFRNGGCCSALETGCGYASTHLNWLPDKMHQASQDVSQSRLKKFKAAKPGFF